MKRTGQVLKRVTGKGYNAVISRDLPKKGNQNEVTSTTVPAADGDGTWTFFVCSLLNGIKHKMNLIKTDK